MGHLNGVGGSVMVKLETAGRAARADDSWRRNDVDDIIIE